MSYVALYRKFRPQTFDQVRGQDHVVRTLKNQLLYHRIGHAYLFTGTRGTGKTSAAKILAKAVNCLHPVNGEPCNECENCRAINAGSFVDVVEVDAASNNGVDDVRRIIEEVRYTPVKGAYKVFIIDEAHMITGPAFNAFLKTLEEPPAYAVFILATTEPHKLPVTILSRCQRYDFHRIRSEQIAENLMHIVQQEGVEAEEKAVSYIALAGDGSMRDAVSLLDKCIAFNLGEKLTYENVLQTLGTVDTEVFSALFRDVYASDVPAALNIIDEVVRQGKDLTQFTTDFIWYIRNILMVKAADLKDPEMLGISEENMRELRNDAQTAAEAVLLRYIRILSELIGQIRFSENKQILLEVGIIKLAKPQMETDTESLADRIRQLEAGHVQPGPIRQMQQPEMQAPFAGNLPAPSVQEPEEEPEDEFFAGLGISERMRDPDVLADLLADDPADEPAKSEPQEQPKEAPAPPEQKEAIWDKIVHLCENPRIRFTLNKCLAEREGENLLRIYAPNEFVVRQLKEDGVLSYIRELSCTAAGCSLEVQLAPAGSKPQQKTQETGFPEELLNKINFTIGTEEW